MSPVVDSTPIETSPETQTNGKAGYVHESWVSEFEGFQRSTKSQNGEVTPKVLPSSGAGQCAAPQRTRSRHTDSKKVMDNLRAEMKLLHWHKLANEAALKAALLKTKKIKAEGRGIMRPVPVPTTLAMPIEERAAWMQQILEEEQSKPLQVTKDFVSKYEAQEKENEGKIGKEVAAHMRCLRDLRQRIEKREEMKSRRAHHRTAQKQLEGEKKRLLQGKISVCNASHPPESVRWAMKQDRVGQGKHDGERRPQGGQGIPYSEGALSTVLGSLNKLVELEKRVSSLERRNIYDSFRARNEARVEDPNPQTPQHSGDSPTRGGAAGGGGRREGREALACLGLSTGSQIAGSRTMRSGTKPSRLNFLKQRTELTAGGPSQVFYSVRMNQRASEPRIGERAFRRNQPGEMRGIDNTLPRARPKRLPNPRQSRGSSTFLTQLPDVRRKPWAEGGRKAGGDGWRNGGPRRGCDFGSLEANRKRLEARQRVMRDKAKTARAERQDHIVREWMQRRKSTTKKHHQTPLVSSGMASTPSTSSRTKVPLRRSANPSRLSNFYLQEFNNIRAQYTKRNDKLRKELNRRNRGSESLMAGGTRTNTTTRPRCAPVACASSRLAPAMKYRNASVTRARDECITAELRHGNARIVAASGTRPRRIRGRAGLTIDGKAVDTMKVNPQSSSTPKTISAATRTLPHQRNRQRWPMRAGGALPQVRVLGRGRVNGRSFGGKSPAMRR